MLAASPASVKTADRHIPAHASRKIKALRATAKMRDILALRQGAVEQAWFEY